MLYIFDDTFKISEWICSNCVSIPIYKHYKYIVNRFVQLANSLLSAVLVKIKSKEILCTVCFNKSCICVFQKVHKISWILVPIKP
jgi:hypothetical protein